MHLSTTDPAAHPAGTLQGSVPGLQIDRIDPVAGTQRDADKTRTTRASCSSACPG